ncbi:helix-turn-helix transcriptional regulator [Paenibacillus wynnii]|uniref:helix-turn-helix transcriptional regulator n=1 Tax=Paenibacillus wynnii TaxID=268407 RepID=UPI00278F118B|nr:AraC family transcriptional regulator [Paenibacillus wynnii]MDQ0193735.1 AraC-like DNA-binding protein [Paenibacillus wynnii]
MNTLKFIVPPMLHYIISGSANCTPGYRHSSRHHIKVFDLLIVRQGCLYIGEDDLKFELQAGQALILRPDGYHFGTQGCREQTFYYWLHFHTTGNWSVIKDDGLLPYSELGAEGPLLPSADFDIRTFSLYLPQLVTLLQPAKIEELLGQLEQLKASAHLSTTQFKQQMLFQEMVQQLSASMSSNRPASQSTVCAEQAASFLRTHYREEITAQMMKDNLNFHPVYIARCMKREYGCSPMEYLLRYRIEQSKLLLMQTSFTIARIAEEVGFNQAPYFSSSFLKIEGISPRQYRQRFS